LNLLSGIVAAAVRALAPARIAAVIGRLSVRAAMSCRRRCCSRFARAATMSLATADSISGKRPSGRWLEQA
jgi:hypothetical protein